MVDSTTLRRRRSKIGQHVWPSPAVVLGLALAGRSPIGSKGFGLPVPERVCPRPTRPPAPPETRHTAVESTISPLSAGLGVAPARLGEEHLHVLDAPLAKAALA